MLNIWTGSSCVLLFYAVSLKVTQAHTNPFSSISCSTQPVCSFNDNSVGSITQGCK